MMDLRAIGSFPESKLFVEALCYRKYHINGLGWKGVLEHHLNRQESLSLSDDAIRVMDLMDSFCKKN